MPEKGLVSWCFEPNQPQRITSGLNTNSALSPSHIHFTSRFLSLFIFHGHSTRELASSRVTHFILWAYTGTNGSHCQHTKKKSGFGKKCRWMDQKGRNKQEIPGSKHIMYGDILTNSRLWKRTKMYRRQRNVDQPGATNSPENVCLCSSLSPIII